MRNPIQNKDFLCLLNMLDAIQKIMDYTKNLKSADEFFKDTLIFDASLMNFVVVGEMVAKKIKKYRTKFLLHGCILRPHL